MKKTMQILTTLVLLLMTTAPMLNAGPGLNADAGFKVIFDRDENISQNYYKAFGGLGFSSDYYDIYGSYNRWISYSVADSLLNTTDINIHQPGISFTLYPSDLLNIDAGYSFFTGGSSYRAHKLDGSVLLDFENTDVSGDVSYKKTKYNFPGEIQNTALSAGTELSIDINEHASWDISYEYTNTDYDTFGYVYKKHTVRTGFVYISSVNFFLMGGIAGSADNDDVISAMADSGVTFKLFDHLKISGIYMFTADFYKTTSGGGPSSRSTIQSDLSHTGSVSVSVYY